MRPGETIATYDVGLALRGKSGRFEVTSPTGEVYDVTCKSSHSTSSPEWSSNGSDHPPFLIRKVAEGALLAESRATTTGMVEQDGQEEQTATPRLPFVLERAADEGHSSGGNIELLYLEDDGTGQPSACLYLQSESPEHADEAQSLTSRCTTLNELDSEIRRLQAQLDEIQSRAKKMFYKAYAIAESA